MAAHSPCPALGAGTLTIYAMEGRGRRCRRVNASDSEQMVALIAWLPLPAAVSADVERAYTFAPVGQLQDFRVGQGFARVAIAGAPVFLHGAPGKFIVLGDAFIFLRPIDQMNDVANLVVGNLLQQFGVFAVAQFGR